MLAKFVQSDEAILRSFVSLFSFNCLHTWKFLRTLKKKSVWKLIYRSESFYAHIGQTVESQLKYSLDLKTHWDINIRGRGSKLSMYLKKKKKSLLHELLNSIANNPRALNFNPSLFISTNPF